MEKVRNTVIWLVLLLSVACRNQEGARIHQVWNYIKERPDSALSLLNKYSLSDFGAGQPKAEYALLKSIALDKNYVDVTSDSLISVALDYYDRKGNARERMLSWYYLARVQDNAKDFNNAIVSLSRAEEYLAKAEEPYYEGLIHMERESLYNRTHNNTEALVEAKRGMDAFESIGESKQARIARRRVGLDYLANQDFKGADSIFLSMASDKDADSLYRADGYFHFARSKVLQEDYVNALILFETGITQYKGRLSREQAGAYAYSLYMNGRKDEGKALLARLAKDTSKQAEAVVSYYRYLIDQEEGDYRKALQYVKNTMETEDSIARQTMEQSVIKTQREYQQKNRELYQAQAEMRKLSIVGLVILLVLLVWIAITILLYISRRNNQKVAALVSAEEEAKSLLKQINQQNEDLSDQLSQTRKKYIAAYKKRFSKIAHLSETYYTTSGMKDGRDIVYREVSELASFIAKDAHTFRQLERNINSNLSNAMALYREEFPGLEEKEYRFVGYLMAGFPASTIALLTGLSASNVYVKKMRLLASISSSDVPDKQHFVMVLEQ